MTIGIDIRCLAQGKHTGVEEYTVNLLNSLFGFDKDNEYRLFYNSYKASPEIISGFLKYKNVKLCRFRYPNKVLNSYFRFLKYPKIDKMIGDVDVFFSPNIIFSSLSRNCRRIVTFHDLSFERYPEFFSRKRRLWHKTVTPSRLAKKADEIIAVSDSTKQDLVQLYNIDPKKIKVIYSGIEERFSPVENKEELRRVRKKYNLPEKFILFLGTLEPRKNIEGLILAFDKLKQSKNLNLVIAGSKGWLYENIYKTAQKVNSSDNIKFIGYIDPEGKPALYSLAKLFVYPSFWEGFGFPPLEAMACGTPVITSNVSSLPEVIGEAGLLVDPYNINEIAEAMNQVLQGESLRTNLQKKGIERAREFSWGKTAKETLKVFREL